MGHTNKRLLYLAAIVALIAIGTTILIGHKSRDEPGDIEDDRFLLDTLVFIKIYSSNDQSLLNETFDSIEAYENELSRYRPDSEMSRVNAEGTDTVVKISADTLALLQAALDYAKISQGHFDPTVGPLVDLWGIGGEDPRVPDATEIAQALTVVDYRNVAVDAASRTVRLNKPGMKLDLGGVTKGWIADRIAEELAKKGANQVLINLGGNVRVIGGKPGGEPYRIGMQDPFDDRGRYLGIFSLTDGSVVSSGIYERFFEYEDKRYHHIMDTRTGRPVNNGLAAVTVISDRSVDGDALSTALFAMGLDSGMDLVNTLDNVEAAFITTEGTVFLSPGADKIFKATVPDLEVRVNND